MGVDFPAAFAAQLRRAAARDRLERLARLSWPLAWAVTVGVALLSLLALTTGLAAWGPQLAAGLVGLGVLVAAFIYGRKPERHRLFQRIDARLRFPDLVLSAGDWEGAAGEPWRLAQRRQALTRLAGVDWRSAWPVRWPRRLWRPATSILLLMGGLWLVQQTWRARVREAEAARQRENPVVTAQKLKPLEAVFKDWEEAQKIAPSPELKKLLEDLKPLRDQMAPGQMTEQELLLKVNEVQERLRAEQAKLDEGSMEAQAAALADALKNLDGLGGMAAAIERKDFAAARDLAPAAAKRFEKGDAKLPPGAKASAAADRLAQAAAGLGKSATAAAALQQMQAALAGQSNSDMAKGVGQMGNAMAQEAQRQAQDRGLGVQMAQLNGWRDGLGQQGQGHDQGPGQGQEQGQGPGLGQGQREGAGLSLAWLMQQQKGGQGAGTTSDPNRTGDATALNADRQKVNLTGTPGTGASETSTEATNDPHLENTASSVSAADLAAYQRLSEQATNDENLPVADRQLIKRYFESIRPPGGH
jgi:hypothetical protein